MEGPQGKKPVRRGKERCTACYNLNFPKDSVKQVFIESTGPFRANRTVNIKEVVKAMSRGCQICFAILKAIDAIVMPYVSGPPGPRLSGIADVPAPKSSKFPFLAYMPGAFATLNYVNILGEEGKAVQVCVAFSAFYYDFPDGAFPLGRAERTEGSGTEAMEVNFTFELFSDYTLPAQFSGVSLARRVPAKLSSKRRQRLVEGWVDNCNRNHEPCRRPLLGMEEVPGERPWRPRRLLQLSDVLQPGDNPRKGLQLIDTRGWLHHAYAANVTVGHVWKWRSESDDLRTDNLQKLMTGKIPWRDLPPVIQDAALIASEQGIGFLWIHALCVIQDDEEDLNWHIEQAHRIYGQSWLNIALERSNHLHETVLGTRWLNRAKGVEIYDIQIQVFKDGKPYKLYARPVLHQGETDYTGREEFNFLPPLLQSTEFLQEQLIAPRTLHIGMRETAWECRMQTACECTSSPINVTDQTDLGLVSRAKFTLARTVQRRPFAEEERLSPLVGLATCLHPLIGTDKRFVAGLWIHGVEDLARELMWCIGRSIEGAEGPSRRRVSPGDGFTPSWSWVSVVTKYRHKIFGPEDMFQVGEDKLEFCPDPGFRCHMVRTVKPEGIAPKEKDEHCFHAHCWELDVTGRLIEGKIAAKPHRRLHPATGVYEFIAMNREEFRPVPDEPRVSFDLPIEAFRPPHPPAEGAMSVEQVAGDVMLDCDYCDIERRARTDEEGGLGYTRAYFLVLGRLEWPQSNCLGNEGLSDGRRARAAEGCGRRRRERRQV